MRSIREGDQVVLESNRRGKGSEQGEVVQVLEAPPTRRYVVRWADGRLSTLYPGGDYQVQTRHRH